MLQIGHVLVDGLLTSKEAVGCIIFEVGSFVTYGFYVLLARLLASRELTLVCSISKYGETVRG